MSAKGFSWQNGYARIAFGNNRLNIVVHREYPSNEEWRDLQAAVSKCIQKADDENREAFAIVFDARDAGLLSCSMVKEWKAVFEKRKSAISRRVLCTCILVSSFLVRNAVNAFLLVYKPSRPLRVISSEPDAEAFIREEKTGLEKLP